MTLILALIAGLNLWIGLEQDNNVSYALALIFGVGSIDVAIAQAADERSRP